MAAPRFNLTHPRRKRSLVVLRYRCGRASQFCMSTKLFVDTRLWHRGSVGRPKQRVKDGHADRERINGILDDLEQKIQDIVDYLRAGWIEVTRDSIAEELARRKREAQKKFYQDDVLRFLVDLLAENQAEIDKGERGKPVIGWAKSQKKYATLRNHLRYYQERNKIARLRFEDMDQQFFDDFVSVLLAMYQPPKEPMKDVTIMKYVSALKRTLKIARRKKVTTCRHYEVVELDLQEQESDAVALYKNDLLLLYRKFDSLDQHEQRECARLVIGCSLGLRIGDNLRLGPENIEHTAGGVVMVNMKTGKTGAIVKIPLVFKPALDLYERYNWSLPDPPTEQHVNRMFKVVCEKAGITDPVVLGNGKIVPKWTKITTHCMRRSFATNLIISGVREELAMKLTGHKTTAMFRRYIRLDRLMAANMVAEELKAGD